MQIVEPLQSLQALPTYTWRREYSAPFSPEITMIDIDRDTNIYIEWQNKYYQWKQKEAPNLAVEGNRFWSRSIITTTDLASFLDMVIKKPNARTQG